MKNKGISTLKKWPVLLTLILLLTSCENLLQQAVVNQLQLPQPTVSFDSGLYTHSIDIEMEVNAPGAKIYYSLKEGGSVVQEGIYKHPVTVGGHTKKYVLEAYSIKDLALNSAAVTREFNFLYVEVDLPLISPAAGEYAQDQWVTITNAEGSAGAEIWFNIPQHPSFESDVSAYHLYTGPIFLEGDSKNYTVNAYAEAPGLPKKDEESSAQYLIEYPQLTPPVFSPQPGTYPPGRSVTITQAEGGDLWVTTDGSDPSSSPSRFKYSAPISIAQSGSTYVLKVFAEKQNYKSLSSTGTYSINSSSAETPDWTILPDRAGGQLSYDEVVFGSRIWRDFDLELDTGNSEPGRKIFYTITTDGTPPALPIAVNNAGTMEPFTHNGTLEYTDTLSFDSSLTGKTIRINAIEAGPGVSPSSPMIFNYYFDYATVPNALFQYSGNDRSASDQEVPLILAGTPSGIFLIGVELEYAIRGSSDWTTLPIDTALNLDAAEGVEETFDLQLRAVSNDSMLYPSSYIDYLNVTIDKKPPDLSVLPMPEIIPIAGGFHLNGRVDDASEDVDIASITLISEGQSFLPDDYQLSPVDPSYYSYHMDYQSFRSGNNYDPAIEIRYYDDLGNYSTRTFAGMPGVGFVGVASDGGSDTGLSWDNPKQDLQEAIDWAIDNGVPELWVSNDARIIEGDGLLVEDVSTLRIYGGFRKDSHNWSDRQLGWASGQTPLTRDSSTDGRVMVILNSGTGESNTGETLIIDGFYFHDARAATDPQYMAGGALYIEDSGIVLANNIFENNQGTFGGAVNMTESYGYLVNNVFEGNDAYRGGGIYIENVTTTDKVRFYNNSFINNTVSTTPELNISERIMGGGYFITGDGANVDIYGSLFYQPFNWAPGYGGANEEGSQILLVASLTFATPGYNAGGNIHSYSSSTGYAPESDPSYEFAVNTYNNTNSDYDPSSVFQIDFSSSTKTSGARFTRFIGGNIAGLAEGSAGSDFSDMDKDGDYTEMIPMDLRGVARTAPYFHGASR